MVPFESIANPNPVTRNKGLLANISTSTAITPEYQVLPIIRETGNVLQISSLLSFSEVELTLADLGTTH